MRLNLKHILFLLSVVFIANTTHAGRIDRGYQALMQHDYFKAKKLFTKGLKYNSPAASQGLAVIYFRQDNPFHSYDSAYHYIKQSIQGWDMEKQRKKDKWAKFGFTEDSLFGFRQKISTEFYKIAKSIKTEDAYSNFLEMHPAAQERTEAMATRDSIAFFNAVSSNSASAYKAFADKYPESAYSELARQNYYDSQYNELTADGSLNSFVDFIEANPQSPMRARAEQSVFEIVTEPNSPSSYTEFINRYPENQYIDSAWMHIYQQKLMDYSLDSMKVFLTTDVPFKDLIRKDIALFDSIALPFIRNEKYGFMNTAGQVMIPGKYDFASFFQEGLAVVVNKEKYGFVNKQGRLQIFCQFESASDFNNGLAIVEMNGKMGMIDRNGRYLFDCIYDDLGVYSEGVVYASVNDKYGYYNLEGEQVIPHQYDDAYDFHDGVAKVESEGNQSFINNSGEYIVPIVYEEIEPYHDTLYTFIEDGYYGIINHKAQIFVEPIYTAIGTVNNGLAIASFQDRVVYLDTLGRMVIDNGYEPYPNYLLKGEFVDGVAIANKKGKYGRINVKDEVVTAFEFDNIEMGVDLIPAEQEGLWGLFKEDGEVIVKPEYSSLVSGDNGHFVASKGDTLGVILQNGATTVPFSFSALESIGEDLYLVTQNGKVGVYKNEKLIVPIDYDQIGMFDKEFLFLSKAGSLTYYNIKEGILVQLMN